MHICIRIIEFFTAHNPRSRLIIITDPQSVEFKSNPRRRAPVRLVLLVLCYACIKKKYNDVICVTACVHRSLGRLTAVRLSACSARRPRAHYNIAKIFRISGKTRGENGRGRAAAIAYNI
jgi:hypothetical protein